MLATLSGCGLVTADRTVEDGNRSPSGGTATGRVTGEPNDDFADSLAADFDSASRARLQGTIENGSDTDVFDLGPLNAGDRVVIDVDTRPFGSNLDAMIGLFDADRNLVIDNDDTALSLDSSIDFVLRYDSSRFFLVVTASTLADPFRRDGSYRLDVEVRPNNNIPAPAGQTVLLDFDGGSVSAANLGVPFVPAFEAADIHPIYDGQSETIKQAIVARVTDAFDGFDLTIFTTDDDRVPDPPFSTVLFGGSHPPAFEAFGISESIDRYNEDTSDVAIIFTDVFSPFTFTITPSADELGLAIGNIAAHEIGHLLGLNHVDDFTALMDAVSPADTFLDVQIFKRAPLYEPELFPIGFQDAVLLLSQTLGPI